MEFLLNLRYGIVIEALWFSLLFDLMRIYDYNAQMNAVAFDDGHNGVELEKKLLLEDAISDLPAVCSYLS